MLSLPHPPLPAGPGEYCLFLDFDGTLVDLAPTPDEAMHDSALVELLGALSARLDGALAIVSGRQIATLDRLLAPLRVPAAGLHGIERRRADGTLREPGSALRWIDAARGPLRAHVARHPGLLLEDKAMAIAAHYRAAPRHLAATRALLEAQPAVFATVREP